MRRYSDYYVGYVLMGRPVDETGLALTEVEILYGARLQELFMGSNQFYKVLGFTTREEIIAKYREGPDGQPSLPKIYHQSDLARMGVVMEIAFAVIPADEATILAPFGSKYNTSVLFSTKMTFPKVAAAIYRFKFTFNVLGAVAEYIVEPGSIKEKRAKNTSPNFS